MKKIEPLTKEKEKLVAEVELYNNKGLLDLKIKSSGNMRTVFMAFKKSDVKSAAELALKEIDDKIADARVYQNDCELHEFYVGYEEGLKDAKDLIKKALVGVFKE